MLHKERGIVQKNQK